MRKSRFGMLVAAGLLAGGLAGAQDRGQGQARPRGTAEQQPQQQQQQSSCPCPMMGQGGMRGQGGAGGQGGMMGQGGMGGAGMCPMGGMADVKLEPTATGAVLRLTAKSPEQVDDVQRMARMMEGCMSGQGAQQGQPTQRQPAPRGE